MGAAQASRCGPKSIDALRARPELVRDLAIAARLGLTLDEFYDHPDADDHIAAWEIKEDTCQAHGGPRSECPDDEADWFPQMHVCQVEMQLEGAKRLFELKHKEQPYHDGTRTFWAREPSRDFPFRYDDGVRLWMSPVELDPDNDFLT